jgi:hypothetical protein
MKTIMMIPKLNASFGMWVHSQVTPCISALCPVSFPGLRFSGQIKQLGITHSKGYGDIYTHSSHHGGRMHWYDSANRRELA